MEIKVYKTSLTRALTLMKPFGTYGMLIEAFEDGHIELSGIKDRDAVRITLDAENVKEPGELLIDLPFFAEASRKIDGDIVTIIDNKDVCVIVGKKSHYKLLKGDIPKFVVEFNADMEFEMKTEDFMSLVNATIRSASLKDTVSAFSGIRFIAENGTIQATATDKYRLSTKKIAADTPDFTAVVPADLLKYAMGILKDASTLIRIGFVKGRRNLERIVLTMDNVKVTGSLISQSYPDVSRFQDVSHAGENVMTVDRHMFMSAVERPLFLKTENISLQTLELSSDGVKLRTVSQEIGASEEGIECEYNGDDLTVSFNGAFLLDSLRALEDDTVRLHFGRETEPVYIVGSEKSANIQICLPVMTHAAYARR